MAVTPELRSIVHSIPDALPYRSILPADPSVGSVPTDRNFLLRGDNLHALRALAPGYTGRFKLVYMDPPYNTGNQTWVYNDAVNAPTIKKWLDAVVGPEDQMRHEKWWCMMWPRLLLAHRLLREDGVLVISIDDAEQARLEIMLDEIFGERNKIAKIVWKTKTSGNESKHVATQHEYLLMYARNLDSLKTLDPEWRIRKPFVDETLAAAQELIDDETLNNQERSDRMKQWYKDQKTRVAETLMAEDVSPEEAIDQSKDSFKSLLLYHKFETRGLYQSDNLSWPGGGGPTYEILHPVTHLPCKLPKGGWQFIESTMEKKLLDDLIEFGKDETTVPRQKKFLKDIESTVLKSVISDIQGARGSEALADVMGEKVFDFPKPVELVSRLVLMITKPGDLVLDPFAGSGTTGHAILNINAEGEAPRRAVLVQMEETFTRKDKDGTETTVDIEQDITAVRLQRVAEGYTTPKGKQVSGTGDAFVRCVLGEPYVDEVGSPNEDLPRAAWASLLGGYHYRNAEEWEAFEDGPLLCRNGRLAIYFLAGSEERVVTMPELERMREESGDREVVCYCERSLVDEDFDAMKAYRIAIRTVPYDLPYVNAATVGGLEFAIPTQ